jgi:hypothetical protein
VSDDACPRCDIEREAFGVACEEHTPAEQRASRRANVDQQVADNLAQERAKQAATTEAP